jgi:hypothetical protein
MSEPTGWDIGCIVVACIVGLAVVVIVVAFYARRDRRPGPAVLYSLARFPRRLPSRQERQDRHDGQPERYRPRSVASSASELAISCSTPGDPKQRAGREEEPLVLGGLPPPPGRKSPCSCSGRDSAGVIHSLPQWSRGAQKLGPGVEGEKDHGGTNRVEKTSERRPEARILGDVRAVKRGRVGKRIANKLISGTSSVASGAS